MCLGGEVTQKHKVHSTSKCQQLTATRQATLTTQAEGRAYRCDTLAHTKPNVEGLLFASLVLVTKFKYFVISQHNLGVRHAVELQFARTSQL